MNKIGGERRIFQKRRNYASLRSCLLFRSHRDIHHPHSRNSRDQRRIHSNDYHDCGVHGAFYCSSSLMVKKGERQAWGRISTWTRTLSGKRTATRCFRFVSGRDPWSFRVFVPARLSFDVISPCVRPLMGLRISHKDERGVKEKWGDRWVRRRAHSHASACPWGW